jgi:hypothetical protein
LVHGNAETLPIHIDLSAWKGVRSATLVSLSSANLRNRADFATPDSVTRTEQKVTAGNGVFAFDLKGYSITKAVFTLP